MLEFLGGLLALFVGLFGYEKFKRLEEKKQAAEREEVRSKEMLRRQDQATEALVRGVINEEKAVSDPDKHDFTK